MRQVIIAIQFDYVISDLWIDVWHMAVVPDKMFPYGCDPVVS